MMRAKLKVSNVTVLGTSERLQFSAVYKNGYDASGLDEDNTFSKFTPTANLDMYVTNSELHGKFKAGDAFYVDFTPVSPAE